MTDLYDLITNDHWRSFSFLEVFTRYKAAYEHYTRSKATLENAEQNLSSLKYELRESIKGLHRGDNP